MSKSEETKKRIIRVSMDLFNELGPDNVSTVQISRALGMSPGNLYYYYRNKQQIIREIYELMIQEYRDNWSISEMLKPDFNTSLRLINNLRIFFKYRFLVNHMCLLGNNDPKLKKRISQITKERQEELGQYFRNLEVQGIMDFSYSSETVNRLVSVLWFLGDFWLMNREIRSGKIVKLNKEMELEYLQVNLFLTNVYLTPKGKEWFDSRHKEFMAAYNATE
jgi:AcrR family transcriptional regulator